MIDAFSAEPGGIYFYFMDMSGIDTEGIFIQHDEVCQIAFFDQSLV